MSCVRRSRSIVHHQPSVEREKTLFDRHYNLIEAVKSHIIAVLNCKKSVIFNYRGLERERMGRDAVLKFHREKKRKKSCVFCEWDDDDLVSARERVREKENYMRLNGDTTSCLMTCLHHHHHQSTINVGKFIWNNDTLLFCEGKVGTLEKCWKSFI